MGEGLKARPIVGRNAWIERAFSPCENNPVCSWGRCPRLQWFAPLSLDLPLFDLRFLFPASHPLGTPNPVVSKPKSRSYENKSFGIRGTQDSRRVSSEKRRKTSEEREMREKAPTARSYTSLGHRPRKPMGLFPQGLKARSIQPFVPFHSSGLQPL